MSDEVHAEPDKMANTRLVAMVVVTIVSLVAVVIGIVQFWNFTIMDEVSAKQLAAPGSQLSGLREYERGRLDRYQWVNQAEGTLRIPVARAIELTLRDWESRPTGLMDSADKMAQGQVPPAAPAPAPTPAPAPPPGGGPGGSTTPPPPPLQTPTNPGGNPQ